MQRSILGALLCQSKVFVCVSLIRGRIIIKIIIIIIIVHNDSTDAINRLLILYVVHVMLNNRSYPVVGVIGPANSRDAVMVAPLLSVAEIPLIGPYTSSDELSDKTR